MPIHARKWRSGKIRLQVSNYSVEPDRTDRPTRQQTTDWSIDLRLSSTDEAPNAGSWYSTSTTRARARPNAFAGINSRAKITRATRSRKIPTKSKPKTPKYSTIPRTSRNGITASLAFASQISSQPSWIQSPCADGTDRRPRNQRLHATLATSREKVSRKRERPSDHTVAHYGTNSNKSKT